MQFNQYSIILFIIISGLMLNNALSFQENHQLSTTELSDYTLVDLGYGIIIAMCQQNDTCGYYQNKFMIIFLLSLSMTYILSNQTEKAYIRNTINSVTNLDRLLPTIVGLLIGIYLIN